MSRNVDADTDKLYNASRFAYTFASTQTFT